MRLIDATELQFRMMDMIREGYGLEDMVDAVIESEDVDAVPVVRCRDCRHAFWRSKDQIEAGNSPIYCDRYVFGAKPEFYCFDGEKRGGKR